jgi:prevent-host-death family protein
MRELTTDELLKTFHQVLSFVKDGERVLIYQNGHRIAALISAEDLDFLEDAETSLDIERVNESLSEAGSVSWNKVKADLGL